MLLNVPELPTNDDQLPTSDDRKASIYRQAVELPTGSVKSGDVTPSHPLLRYAPDADVPSLQ